MNLRSLTAIVVDGYLSTDGTAQVKLTRSIPLTDGGWAPNEKHANVTIESSAGDIYSLTEGDSALYTAAGIPVSFDAQYTLHIRTADGSEYTSDQVQAYPTPPIDNIFYTLGAGRETFEVRIDATDPNPDATGYYLWDCIETYEYHAPVFAGYKIVNGQPIERDPSEVVYTCWRDVTNPSVVLDANYLEENDIQAQRVVIVGNNSPKLAIKYSVLVKQRAISEAEYAFRTQLQKSNEQQGNLFSVVPGAVVGNVHSADPEEYVLGYFRAQDVTERRLFIERWDLPDGFFIQPPSPSCQTEKTCDIGPGPGRVQQFGCFTVDMLGPSALVTSANTNGAGVVESYNFVIAACGDCRYYGGTTTRPSFWE